MFSMMKHNSLVTMKRKKIEENLYLIEVKTKVIDKRTNKKSCFIKEIKN